MTIALAQKETMNGLLSLWMANGVLGLQLAECRAIGKDQFVLRPQPTLLGSLPKYYKFDYELFERDWMRIMSRELNATVHPLQGTMHGYIIVERTL
jgi:hypothetical protein